MYSLNLNKVMVASAAFLVLINFGSGSGVGDEDNDERSQVPTNIIDAAKLLYSLPTATRSWFLPPNLDFRVPSGWDEEAEFKEEKASAASKVKDAVVKSLDKSIATVQDSAKSAAEFADKTLNNLKHMHEPDL